MPNHPSHKGVEQEGLGGYLQEEKQHLREEWWEVGVPAGIHQDCAISQNGRYRDVRDTETNEVM